MPNPDYKQQAHLYALRGMQGSDYIAFREVASRGLITKSKVLDIGCGAGRSSRFLKELGNEVTGIDISEEMIAEARKSDPSGNYLLIGREPPLPFKEEQFEAFFSSWMLLEEGSRERILMLLKEYARVLRRNGTGIVIVNTPEFYRGEWVSCQVNFPENKGVLASGQQVRARLVPEGVEVSDYFWSDRNYKRFFNAAGLNLIDEFRPLGKPDDPILWKDEIRMAPYVIYLLRKGKCIDS